MKFLCPIFELCEQLSFHVLIDVGQLYEVYKLYSKAFFSKVCHTLLYPIKKKSFDVSKASIFLQLCRKENLSSVFLMIFFTQK